MSIACQILLFCQFVEEIGGWGGGAAGITGYVGNTCRFPLHIATLVPGSAELGYFIITM